MKDVVKVRKRRPASYSRDNVVGDIIESKIFKKNAGQAGEKGRGGEEECRYRRDCVID
jgi:hypothetical protein